MKECESRGEEGSQAKPHMWQEETNQARSSGGRAKCGRQRVQQGSRPSCGHGLAVLKQQEVGQYVHLETVRAMVMESGGGRVPI